MRNLGRAWVGWEIIRGSPPDLRLCLFAVNSTAALAETTAACWSYRTSVLCKLDITKFLTKSDAGSRGSLSSLFSLSVELPRQEWGIRL